MRTRYVYIMLRDKTKIKCIYPYNKTYVRVCIKNIDTVKPVYIKRLGTLDE